MDTVPTEVLRYMLDNVSDPDDLVAFHRLSSVYTSTVDSEYWRHRVSQLLSVPIPPTPNVQWNTIYDKLVKLGNPAKYLLTLLNSNVPDSVILEWVSANQPTNLLAVLTTTTRFELIPRLVPFVDLKFSTQISTTSISELVPTDPLVAQLRNRLDKLDLYNLFQALLSNPMCPLEVIVALDDSYHFITLAEYQLISSGGRKVRYLQRCLKHATREEIYRNEEEIAAKVDFILQRAPAFRLDGDYQDVVMDMVLRLDSTILFLQLLSDSTPQHIHYLLYTLRYELLPNPAELLVSVLSVEQIAEEVQIILNSSIDDQPTPFDAYVLQHPSIDREYLISEIMPVLFRHVRDYIYEGMTLYGENDEHDDQIRKSLDIWQRWGITDPDIFLDPRTYDYIDNYYDILRLLSEVPYDSNPTSKYFSLLLRLDVDDGEYFATNREDFAHYIQEYQPELGDDQTLWRNLVAAGKYSLVLTLLKYAAYRLQPPEQLTREEKKYRRLLEQLGKPYNPQAILDWINSW
jgi:hypothetical protein